MGASDNAGSATKKPSRAVALLLGIFGPWGTGQFYLGQKKRAVLWLVGPSIVLVLGALALPLLGGILGYGVWFGALLLGAVVTEIACLVDLRFIPKARLTRTPRLAVLGFWVGGVIVAIVLRIPPRALLIEAFATRGASMSPTLLVGDYIMADKIVPRFRKPKRGMAIVFRSPEPPTYAFVKRVIAIEGDELEVKNGHPWLNGWEVPHCPIGKVTLSDATGEESSSGELELEYLDGEAYLVFFDERAGARDTYGPYRAARGEVWVLGDNRNNSHDSRFWFGGRGGGLPLDQVRGRALFRWASVGAAGIDWSRYGTPISEPLLPASMKNLQPELDKCLSKRPLRDKTVPPGLMR